MDSVLFVYFCFSLFTSFCGYSLPHADLIELYIVLIKTSFLTIREVEESGLLLVLNSNYNSYNIQGNIFPIGFSVHEEF